MVLCVTIFSMNIPVYAISYDNQENVPKVQATLLMEADSGQVVQHKNGYEKVPVGTLNKMMTALLMAEALEEGVFSRDTMITASPNANSMKQASIWLMAGEKMSFEDLLKGVVIGNANDASVALAEALYDSEEEFVKHMNTRAFELGMRDTVYVNCTGYDNENQYSTAYDTALLAREMIKHSILVEYMTVWLDYLRGEDTELVNENSLVRNYDGILGVKAGHSNMSGNCLALAVKKQDTSYIAVILGCADKNQRFSMGKELINIGFSSYQPAVPYLSSEYLLPVKVRRGVDSAVELDIGELSAMAVPKGREDDITCVIIMPEYMNAPIRKNQKIGSVVFYLDDTVLCTTDIVAKNSVEQLTLWISLKEMCAKLLK